ncbi:hypothetical protein LguiB_029060 [Lonicera macranthoides]
MYSVVIKKVQSIRELVMCQQPDKSFDLLRAWYSPNLPPLDLWISGAQLFLHQPDVGALAQGQALRFYESLNIANQARHLNLVASEKEGDDPHIEESTPNPIPAEKSLEDKIDHLPKTIEELKSMVLALINTFNAYVVHVFVLLEF